MKRDKDNNYKFDDFDEIEEFDEIGEEEVEDIGEAGDRKAFWESDEKKDNIFLRICRKKVTKIILIALEVFAALCLIFGIWLVYGGDSKTKAISFLTQCSLGKSLVGCVIGDVYDNSMYDEEFDDSKIYNVELEGDYTNIALFGVDSRNGDDASLNNNSDTIIILSINNETGDVKLASIYRDTMLQFEIDGGTSYAKATDIYAYGGPETLINSLNKNFDLNIKDYITVNWSGLVNVIDAFGGIDANLTEEEVYWTNDYIKDLNYWTGAKLDLLSSAGKQHLNGIQATSYCRIRYVSFFDPDTGEEIANDFGRTARQRYVIGQLLENAKNSSVSKLLEVVDELLSTNTKENTFMKSSLTLDEMISLVPLVLELEFTGGEGYPTSYTPFTLPNGGSSLAPNTLLTTAEEIHKYLFPEYKYKASDTVKSLDEQAQAFMANAGKSEESTEETTQETKTAANADNKQSDKNVNNETTTATTAAGDSGSGDDPGAGGDPGSGGDPGAGGDPTPGG